MSTSQLRERIAALHAQAAELGRDLAAQASGLEAGELFEVAGELQGVLNAAGGAQLVAVAHAAAHETRLTDRGPVGVHHGLGFVDAMAPTEVSLATGVGQWAAGRTVSLAAALAERFPRVLAQVVTGRVCTGTAGKVVAACDGLDAAACAAVEAVLVDRLAEADPARVSTLTRRVATRVAAEQVRAAQARNRRQRCVEVRPGPDGTSTWWAQLPTDRSAAAWAAITALGQRYTERDPALSTDQARADAFLDLLLTNVTVTAKVTLGIPVITGPDGHAARDEAAAQRAAENTTDQDDTLDGHERDTTDDDAVSDVTGVSGAFGAASTGCQSPAVATGGLGLGAAFRLSAALNGCEIPGIGFIDADTIEALLTTVPVQVGRALLDARTGTLLETTTTAYRPPAALTDFVTTRDGTCRMWGCTRPARTCDIDHARPWPAGATTPTNLGGLCRRHHRLKQRRRWTYELHPDGTATWTSPTERRRTTPPEHTPWPPQPPPPRASDPPPVTTTPTAAHHFPDTPPF